MSRCFRCGREDQPDIVCPDPNCNLDEVERLLVRATELVFDEAIETEARRREGNADFFGDTRFSKGPRGYPYHYESDRRSVETLTRRLGPDGPSFSIRELEWLRKMIFAYEYIEFQVVKKSE